MEWTLTNLVVQIVAGFLGAHGAASAATNTSLDFWVTVLSAWYAAR